MTRLCCPARLPSLSGVHRHTASARSFTSAAVRCGPSAPAPPTLPTSNQREYFYDVNKHGELFLSTTKIKNFTSCFKDKAFLDFFFSRVRAVGGGNGGGDGGGDDRGRAAEEDRGRIEGYVRDGYGFVSPCGREINWIRAEDSVVVFGDLSEDGKLTWGGTFKHDFEPSRLKVDAETGYLYHPSPSPPTRSRRRAPGSAPGAPTVSPFGPYSLLRSSLVISKFADGLDVDVDVSTDGNGGVGRSKGGRYRWGGKEWEIGVLRDEDVIRLRKAN